MHTTSNSQRIPTWDHCMKMCFHIGKKKHVFVLPLDIYRASPFLGTIQSNLSDGLSFHARHTGGIINSTESSDLVTKQFTVCETFTIVNGCHDL